MFRKISFLLVLAGLLQGCSLMGMPVADDQPKPAKVENYEVAGVSVEMADAITADLVDILKTYYPPAKHQFVFRPGDAVLGLDLGDRLRVAGYGVLSQPTIGRPELFYIADQLPRQMYRVSLRIGDWRLDRLYRFDANEWKGFGSTSNKQAKGVLVRPVVKVAKKVVKPKPHGLGRVSVPQKSKTVKATKPVVVKEVPAEPVVKVVPRKVVKPRKMKRVYFVQVMAGADEKNLAYNKSLLESDDFDVSIMPLQSKPISALRVGAWSKKSDAEIVKKRLSNVYHDAFIWEALL